MATAFFKMVLMGVVLQVILFKLSEFIAFVAIFVVLNSRSCDAHCMSGYFLVNELVRVEVIQ